MRRHEPALSPEFQGVLEEFRSALRSEPLSVAFLVSGMLDLMASPPEENDLAQPSLLDLVEAFMSVSVAETTAALTVIATLTNDELMATRIRRELAGRRHPLPADVAELDRVTISRTVRMDAGVGSVGVRRTPADADLLLELSGPGVRPMTLILHVDHRYGSLVKDAIPVPEDVSSTITRLSEIAGRDGITPVFTEMEPADARACIEGAIAAYETLDHGLPPQDFWPILRPLVRHLVRDLPLGGVGFPPGDPDTFMTYADEEDDEDDFDSTDLAHDFLESEDGLALTGSEEVVHDLAHSLATYALGRMPDELRWKPDDVRDVLTEYLPVVAPGTEEDYAMVPEVLRAFIRFCHDEEDLPRPVTRVALQAVDRWRPDYLAAQHDPVVMRKRSDFQRELLFAGLADYRRDMAITLVGSEEALEFLDDEPLPAEELDLDGVAPDILARVRSVGALVDRAVETLYQGSGLEVELRTVCRRILARVARADSDLFRGRTRNETDAAAIVWIAGRGNETLGVSGTPPLKHLMAAVGVRVSPAARAGVLLDAIGRPKGPWGTVTLADPDLLISAQRRFVLTLLDD